MNPVWSAKPQDEDHDHGANVGLRSGVHGRGISGLVGFGATQKLSVGPTWRTARHNVPVDSRHRLGTGSIKGFGPVGLTNRIAGPVYAGDHSGAPLPTRTVRGCAHDDLASL
jgi:hypothetical protein